MHKDSAFVVRTPTQAAWLKKRGTTGLFDTPDVPNSGSEADFILTRNYPQKCET
jgi:hypothetical protein